MLTPSTPGAPLFLHLPKASHTCCLEYQTTSPVTSSCSPDSSQPFRLISYHSAIGRPLRSTPITGGSPLLRAGPPPPRSVLSPQFRRSGSPCRPTHTARSVSTRVFPCSLWSPQSRLTSPPCRAPPGQSALTRQAHPEAVETPRFRCHVDNHFDTSVSDSLAFVFPAPPDTSPAPFPHRSPPRLPDQQHEVVWSLPSAGRPRRAKPSSAAQHRHQQRLPTHRAPNVRGTPGLDYCCAGGFAEKAAEILHEVNGLVVEIKDAE